VPLEREVDLGSGPATQRLRVYRFRRIVALAVRPERPVVHVSRDNRYQLFVKGQRVAAGPARGDLSYWRCETVDVAGHLTAAVG